MAEAQAFLARLEARYRNVDIDWEGQLEAAYLGLLRGRAALGVIDIGGHAGRHSTVIQRELHPAHLMIFEPLPAKRAALAALFAGQEAVSIHGVALGNESRETTFVVKTGAPEESGLRRRSFYNDGSTADLETIPMRIETLDALLVPFRVDYIKIDTEGGEIDILRGGAGLLRRDRPLVSVEYGIGGFDAYGHRPETLFQLAEQAGYGVYDLFGNRFAGLEEWVSCVSRFYWDYLLVPENASAAVAGRLAELRVAAERRFLPG